MAKVYEISHDFENDSHILMPATAGVSAEDCQRLEGAIVKKNKERRQKMEEMRRLHKEAAEKMAARRNAKQRDRSNLGGKPSAKEGGCTSCNKKKNSILDIVKGGAKLLQAELGVGAAGSELFETRKAICLACPAYDFGVCTDCKCFLKSKCSIKSERCPQEKW